MRALLKSIAISRAAAHDADTVFVRRQISLINSAGTVSAPGKSSHKALSWLKDALPPRAGRGPPGRYTGRAHWRKQITHGDKSSRLGPSSGRPNSRIGHPLLAGRPQPFSCSPRSPQLTAVPGERWGRGEQGTQVANLHPKGVSLPTGGRGGTGQRVEVDHGGNTSDTDGKRGRNNK